MPRTLRENSMGHLTTLAFLALSAATAQGVPTGYDARDIPPTTEATSVVVRATRQDSGAHNPDPAEVDSNAARALNSLYPVRRLARWDRPFTETASKWSRILDAARDCPDLRRLLFALEDQAKQALGADPRLYRRPTRLQEVLPELIDERFRAAGRNGEQFALAMADCGQANFVRGKGVPLAIMAVYTSNSDYLQKCIEILTAMLDHAPLQRPGWTAYTPEARLDPGGDGVWLATSWGLEGIIDMLAILGDRVPGELRTKLDAMIRREVSLIVADWADSRPWYVKSRTIQSNQWMEPTIGLIKACLHLQDERLRGAYDLGVENLAASLAALGQDGAFAEGVTYASMTVGPLFGVLEELRSSGDLRCQGMGYALNAWKWFLHMQMPDGRYVNCYDSIMGVAPEWATKTPLPSLIEAAIGSGDPDAVAVTRSFFPNGDASLPGIRFQAALCKAGSTTAGAAPALPVFAHFPSQALVVWRSKWEPVWAPQSAMGLWIRGGSATDSHSHRDQGHVSVYWGSRPILMEAGTPTYANPEMEPRYASAAGHGIMQVSELRPRNRPVAVPLSVEHLDASGGRVSVDTTMAYEGVAKCTRTVTWSDRGTVAIDDAVSFRSPVAPGSELYRFHTGATEPLTLAGSGSRWSVSWPGATMTIDADHEIALTQQPWPDAVSLGQIRHHQAIGVSCPAPATGLVLRTAIMIEPSNQPAAERPASGRVTGPAAP